MLLKHCLLFTSSALLGALRDDNLRNYLSAGTADSMQLLILHKLVSFADVTFTERVLHQQMQHCQTVCTAFPGSRQLEVLDNKTSPCQQTAHKPH